MVIYNPAMGGGAKAAIIIVVLLLLVAVIGFIIYAASSSSSSSSSGSYVPSDTTPTGKKKTGNKTPTGDKTPTGGASSLTLYSGPNGTGTIKVYKVGAYSKIQPAITVKSYKINGSITVKMAAGVGMTGANFSDVGPTAVKNVPAGTMMVGSLLVGAQGGGGGGNGGQQPPTYTGCIAKVYTSATSTGSPNYSFEDGYHNGDELKGTGMYHDIQGVVLSPQCEATFYDVDDILSPTGIMHKSVRISGGTGSLQALPKQSDGTSLTVGSLSVNELSA